VFLHVSPEAAIGGTLALVQNGDIIDVDVAERRLHLDVSDEELEERKKKWKAPVLGFDRGYVQLHLNHVEQSHLGVDLDFLKGNSGSIVTRDSH